MLSTMRWGCLVPVSVMLAFSCGDGGNGGGEGEETTCQVVGDRTCGYSSSGLQVVKVCGLVGTEAEAAKEWIIDKTCSTTQCCHQGQCIDVEDGVKLGAQNCSPLKEGEACNNEKQCGEELTCYDGMCCAPDCRGKECGDDGCGGDCGSCEGALSVCVEGYCECEPYCSGMECGDDGCGGYCGSCDQGLGACDDGECIYECWTDSSSGLMWQASAPAGVYEWAEAHDYCNGLTLCGYSDWELPDIGELRSLIRGCASTELASSSCYIEPGGCLDSSCNDGDLCEVCSQDSGPADGCYWPSEMQGTCSRYWSSSRVEDDADGAWHVAFNVGAVYAIEVDGGERVRCVR